MHPEHVFKIPEEKSLACCSFLEDFLGNDGRVFSSNYDLLLYWVLMRNTSKNAGDGFGREHENPLGDKYIPDYEPEFSELRGERIKTVNQCSTYMVRFSYLILGLKLLKNSIMVTTYWIISKHEWKKGISNFRNCRKCNRKTYTHNAQSISFVLL
jgi:hypothetical protein